MKKSSTAVITLFTLLTFCINATPAQITIKLPDISIKGKKVKTDGPVTNGKNTDTNVTTEGRPTTDRKLVYPPQRPNGTPVLLKNSVYVRPITHNEYWKMPNQRNYSSWVPELRFNDFVDNKAKAGNYTAEYFNPDGSPWYSEKLEPGFYAADRTLQYKSPSPWGGVLDTKSTAATGVFSFKVTDQNTSQVVYQGKFKVGKFGISHSPQEKNKVSFFVDHDWLMPFGMIGFHHAMDPVGPHNLLVSVWLKGPVDAKELEGRIFYKGQQIATTADGGGASDYDDRSAEFSAAFAPDKTWKRWEFQWRGFIYDNNGTFNRENFPNAFYPDKNPGEYTVRIYRNGTQIRELSFTVGADGRYAVPGYSSQIFLPYYRILLPVKVIGTAEKWNVSAWKTDAFYGNPLAGFAIQ